jgi:hypothetical protein
MKRLTAAQQPYAGKPIRFILPNAPGGNNVIAAFNKAEIAQYAQIIKAANIKIVP